MARDGGREAMGMRLRLTVPIGVEDDNEAQIQAAQKRELRGNRLKFGGSDRGGIKAHHHDLIAHGGCRAK